MASAAGMVDAPVIAVALMCWLLAIALSGFGIVVFVKWLLKRTRR
jgi:hypothetical protein